MLILYMNKKSKQTIIETMFLLTDLNDKNFSRHMKPFKLHNPANLESWISSYRNGSLKADDRVDEVIEVMLKNLKGSDKEQEEIKQTIINLNNLLNNSDKIKPIVDLEEEMKKIQVKNFITTNEMSEIYNISISSQKDYRGRLNDPLPFTQKKFRGKINYIVEDIEKWLKNQHR